MRSALRGHHSDQVRAMNDIVVKRSPRELGAKRRMAKGRTRKNSSELVAVGETSSALANFPVAILDVASEDFSLEVSSVQIAASGVIFVRGWADDRSSKLRQVSIRGQTWSKTIDGRHLGGR